jgi:putative aldouronate transport system substrate-binding protein
MRRKLTGLCALFVILAMLAGCSAGTATTAPDASGAASSGAAPTGAATATDAPAVEAENSNLNEIGTLPIVKEKITLTAYQFVRDTDATTVDDNLWYVQKNEEDTNIHVDYTQVNKSDWSTQMNLMFASGEYPDLIINGDVVDAEIYGVDQGILLPVNDLIDQYMPIYKERLAMDDIVSQSLVKSDGKMYAIGQIADSGNVVAMNYFINQTWLKNLGLETPKNLDELYEVLVKFVNDDPNGNGKKDEIGYEGYFDEIVYFFFPFGIPENAQHIAINDDKQVVFVPEMEGYRQAIEYMSKLYAEGLMDPAVITQDRNAKTATANNNNVGFLCGLRLKSYGWDILQQDMTWMEPPVAEGYEVLMDSKFSTAQERVFFTCTNEYLAESACWVDYHMTDQAMFETYYGPEGTLWNWNDEGKCELGPDGDQGVMEYSLGVNGMYYMPSVYYNNVFQQPDYRIEVIEYDEKYKALGVVEQYPNEYLTKLVKIGAEEKTQINQIFANIEALYDQYVAEMIMHGVTDDSWNNLMNQLKAAGSDQYIAYYQAALDAYFASR